ncbi:MAG: permease [Candidatus Saccharibacteria bacterium]|nr:permease [Candidatus Saccharibacteria bacterium]
MTPILISFAAFLSTFCGGITAVKNIKRLHYVLGLTAGVILGVVAFDLLPEIFKLAYANHIDPTKPMIALVVGFLLFHIVEKNLLIHHAHESEYGKHKHPQVGMLSALALSGHSFLDGVGIGLGFHVNTTVGIAVALAVIGHDFADGLNTVTLMLNHKNPIKRATKFLLLDAIAPVLGAISTLFFTLSDANLVLYLGFFAGFLLYIGASDILPQAHEENSSRRTIALTVLGTAFIFLVTRAL